MNNRLRKALAFLLTLVMITSSTPVQVLAQVNKVYTSSPVSVMSIVDPSESGDDQVEPADADHYITYQFMVNGDEVDKQIIKSGEGTLVQPATPEVPTGKRFEGWYVDGAPVSFGAVAKVDEDMTITVNAQFSEVFYVYFIGQQQEVCATGEATSANGYKVPLPTDYEPKNARVTGWHYRGTNTAFTADDVVTEDTYVEAELTHCYWVTFNTMGGSSVPSSYVDEGETLSLSGKKATRPGYTLAGWSTTEGGTTSVGNSVKPTEDVMLYAIWQPAQVTYTIVYWGENADDDGYSYLASNNTKMENTGTTLNLNATTGALPNNVNNRDKFTFDHADENVVVQADGTTVINVYFKRKTYTLSFHGPTCGKVEHTHGWGCLLGCGKQEHTHNNSCYSIPPFEITAKFDAEISGEFGKAPFTTTYKGRAWEASSLYSYALQTLDRMPGQDVTFDLYTQNSYVMKTMYYYVQKADSTANNLGWGTPANEYELLKTVQTYFNYATYEEEYHPIRGFTRFDKNASGFESDNIKYFDNNKLSFYYKRNRYPLTYNNYGATDTEQVMYGASLANKNKQLSIDERPKGFSERAVFEGWYTVDRANITATTPTFDFNTTMPVDGLTLYALWQEPQISVGINVAIAGAQPFDETVNVPVGTSLAQCSNYTGAVTYITNNGKEVLRWINADTGKPVNVYEPLYESVHISPVFMGAVYHVTYQSGAGSGTAPVDEKTYAASAKAKALANTFTAPADETFAYWMDQYGEKRYYPGQYVTVTTDMTLTAIYTPILDKATVVYHENFGDSIKTYTDTAKYTVNDTITILEYADTGFATHDGYKFIGWSTTASSSTAGFAPGARARVDAADDSNHLYAVWMELSATINYVAEEDGTVSVDRESVRIFTGNATGSTAAPNTGYEFDGWYDEENNKVSDSPTYVPQKKLGLHYVSATYYARFKPIQYNVTYSITNNVPAVTVPAQATAAVGQSVTAAGLVSAQGYDFDGWYLGTEKVTSFIMPANHVTLTGSFTARTDTAYKVERYYQQLNADSTLAYPEEPDQTISHEGTTNTTVEATSDDKAAPNSAYVLDAAAGNVLSGTVAPDGSLVLKVYFKLNQSTYTIHHYLDGTTIKVADDQTGTAIIGETVTAAKTSALYEAYAQATVSRFDSAASVTLAVNPAENVITVYYKVPLTIKAQDAQWKYDGQAHTSGAFDVTGLVNGDTKESITLSMTAESSITHAGTVDNIIDATSVQGVAAYYTPTFEEGELKVTQRSVTLTSATAQKPYDGTPLTDSAITVGGDGFVQGEGAAYTVTGAQTAKGSSSNAFTYALHSNTLANDYNIATSEGTLTVTGAEVKVTIKGNSMTVNYDGTQKTVSGYTFLSDNEQYTAEFLSISDENKAKFTVSGTDAGSYTMNVAENGAAWFTNTNTNFDVAVTVENGTLTIAPLDLTVTIVGNSVTVDYDGQEKTVSGYTIGNVTSSRLATVPEDLFTLNDIDFTGTDSVTGKNAGDYDMGLTDADFTCNNDNFENVNFIVNDGKLTIKPIGATVTVTGTTASVNYDGDEHTVSGYDLNFSTPLMQNSDIDFTGSDTVTGKDAGDYPMGLTAANFSCNSDNFKNVNFIVNDGKLTIKPIGATVTVTGATGSVNYDGDEHTVSGYDLAFDTTLMQAGDIVFTASETVTGTATGKNAGDYNMGLTAANFSCKSKNFENVNFVVKDGKLTIKPIGATVTVTGATGSEDYDGSEHTVSGYTLSFSTPLMQDSDIDFTGTDSVTGKNAGDYDMGLTVANFSCNSDNFENVNFIVNDGGLTIAPKAITVAVTGNSAAGLIYKGSGYTVQGFTAATDDSLYDVTNVALKKGMQAKVTGTDASATPYTMGLTSEHFINNDRNFTVTFTVIDGTLKIDKRAVTMTAHGATKAYGEPDPAFTGDIEKASKSTDTGLVKANDLGKITFYRTNADEWVDTYSDVLTADYTENANYDVRVVNANFVITGDPIAVEKTTPEVETPYALNAEIPFTVTVHNHTNHLLRNVEVKDDTAVLLAGAGYDIADGAAIIAEIPVGGSAAVNLTHTVTSDDILAQRYVNTAQAMADERTIAATATVDALAEIDATLQVVKKEVSTPANGSAYVVDETIRYEITVANRGNVPMQNIVVNDKKTGLATTLNTLDVGQEVTLRTAYAVTLADAEVGSVTNLATAQAEPIAGWPDIVPYGESSVTVGLDPLLTVAGVKRWADAANAYNTRPAQITVELRRNDELLQTTQVSAASDWAYSFEKLPGWDAEGNQYTYTVRENFVPGYQTRYSNENFDIENVLTRHTLRVRYWYGAIGNETAQNDFVHTYSYGQTYNVVSPVITGYTASYERVTGVIAGDMVLDVVYMPNSYMLTIEYIYGNGTMAAATYEQQLVTGTGFTVDSPVIPDYQPSVWKVSGTVENQDLVYTVIYVPTQTTILIDNYMVPLGVGDVNLNLGDCFE